MNKSDKSTVAENEKGTRSSEGIRKAGAAEKADQAKAKVQELGDRAKEAAPESAGEGVQQAQQLARRNPIPVAIGVALLVGFVLGRISSR